MLTERGRDVSEITEPASVELKCDTYQIEPTITSNVLVFEHAAKMVILACANLGYRKMHFQPSACERT
jgi:hypothetical protein